MNFLWSKCSGSRVISTKENVNFKLQSTSMSLVCHNNYFIKRCSYFEDLSTQKISWLHIDWFKFLPKYAQIEVDYLS
jgi:hypothetical protein